MNTSRRSRRTPQVERVSGLKDAKDRREALEAVARAFRDSVRTERHLERTLWHPSVFRPEHTRVTVAHGRVVSVVVMTPRMMRFGPVTVRAMTIGPVGTHDRYRHRGYSAAAMNDASRFMADHGYLLAYLGGIPRFYYRFGYYPYMARPLTRFDRDQAMAEARPGRLRTMTRRDLARVRAIHDQVTAQRICAAARPNEVWDWLIGPASRTWVFAGPKVILDGRARVCGHLTIKSKGGLDIGEIVVRQDEASCRAALGALARVAKRREIKEITLPLPWDDTLAVFLRHYVTTTCTLTTNPTGGSLLKIVDFPALMHRLQPLFTQRLREAHAAHANARFTLESDTGAVGLAVGRKRVRVGAPVHGERVHIPQRWLSGLVTGYHAVQDIAPRRGVVVPPELLGVMATLFPPGWPFVYRGDNL